MLGRAEEMNRLPLRNAQGIICGYVEVDALSWELCHNRTWYRLTEGGEPLTIDSQGYVTLREFMTNTRPTKSRWARWDSDSQKFEALGYIGGKTFSLGYFNTEQEAARHARRWMDENQNIWSAADFAFGIPDTPSEAFQSIRSIIRDPEDFK